MRIFILQAKDLMNLSLLNKLKDMNALSRFMDALIMSKAFVWVGLMKHLKKNCNAHLNQQGCLPT